MPVEDLSLLPFAERGTRARELVDEEVRRPFDMAQGPMLRAKLLRLAAEDQLLVITLHRLAADPWSLGILHREWSALYLTDIQGHAPTLPELPMTCSDFARRQRRQLEDRLLDTPLDYWKQKLGGKLPITELPGERSRPPVQTYRARDEAFRHAGFTSRGVE